MRAIFQWNVGSRVLELGRRTLIMGVVNATPDSFSDGGLYIDAEKAVVRAEKLLDDGATIIDVGGESTRPGASEPVSEEEERRRVLPVIRDLKRRRPDAVISVDTYKSSVARAAVEAGLRLLVQTRAQAKIRRLRGKVRWQGDLETSRLGHVSK